MTVLDPIDPHGIPPHPELFPEMPVSAAWAVAPPDQAPPAHAVLRSCPGCGLLCADLDAHRCGP